MARTVTAQVIEQEGYTKPELRWRLSQYRGDRLPSRTFDYWLQRLSSHGVDLKPNKFGLYEDEDLKTLTRLVFWLKRGLPIEGFAEIVKQEYSHAN